MNVLNVSHIQKSYGVDAILKDVTFSLEEGERVGLIGRNGAGKSTLFKILIGLLDPDAGQVSILSGLTVGYLEQHNDALPNITLLSFCMEVFSHLIGEEIRLKDTEILIQNTDHNDPGFNDLLIRYQESVEAFENNGGFTFVSRVKGVLKGLSFDESDFDRQLNSLSGGQLTRLNIARLLLKEPDILLLDEPTNHLDISAVQWLENYLKQYRGTLLLITHDRFFLDQVTTRIIEIEHGRAISHTGNYSHFQEFKRKNIEIQQKTFEKQEAELLKQEELIRRFKQHGTEKLAKRAKSREKRLEQILRIEAPEDQLRSFRLQFDVQSPSGRDVLQCNELCFGYGESLLFKDVNFNLYKGDKVGLIGPNGIGKSTLFKIILGALDLKQGHILKGHNVLIQHYDQNLEFSDPELSLLEELVEHRPDLTNTYLRTLLGAFLFTGEDVLKPIKTLSGGEKARLALIKLLLNTGNFLLLDEPTNHLDIAAREVLEDALINYEGTLLFISHDRYFLDRVCTKIFDLSENGIDEYYGNYSYSLHKQAENSLLESAEEESITKTHMKNQKRKEKEQEKADRAFKKEVQVLEERIEILEQEIESLNFELCKEEIYSNPDKSKAIRHQLNHLTKTLENTYQHWTQKVEQLN